MKVKKLLLDLKISERELASELNIRESTVRRWNKKGIPTCYHKRIKDVAKKMQKSFYESQDRSQDESKKKQIINDLAVQIEQQSRSSAKVNFDNLSMMFYQTLENIYPQATRETLRAVGLAIFDDEEINEPMIFAEVQNLNKAMIADKKPLRANPVGGIK